MENNISKEFYLLCKEDGITKIESKADVARMILAAKNNGFKVKWKKQASVLLLSEL